MFKKLILIITIQSLILSPTLFMFEKANAQANLGEVVAGLLSGLGTFTAVTQSAASVADAQRAMTVPIFDVVEYAQLRSVETAKATKETKEKIIQILFSIFLESLRRQLLDTVVNEIIGWVNGEGEPQFVGNWENFLKDAANVAIGDVILQTDAAFLCSPFKNKLVNLYKFPVPEFSQRVECTLDDVVDNIEDFYENFENGGWLAYNEVWQPQNNYYGQIIMINDEITFQTAAKQEAAKNEALAGKGFLPFTRCRGGGTKSPDSGRNYVKDSEGNYCLPEDLETITPGELVGSMTSKAIGVDIDYILTAEELEQYVSAITDAVINRVVKEGVGLINLSLDKITSEEDISVYTKPYEDGLTEIQEQEKERIIGEYQNILNDRNAILEYKKDSFSTIEQIMEILEKFERSRCREFFTPSVSEEISTDFSELTKEIEGLEVLIDEIEALKAESESISPDYRLREMGVLNDNYNNFLSDYDDIIIEVYSGEALKDAQEEAENLEEALINYTNQLISCI